MNIADFVQTDIEWEPDENFDPVICKRCGHTIGYHMQHADGRITCVKYAMSADSI